MKISLYFTPDAFSNALTALTFRAMFEDSSIFIVSHISSGPDQGGSGQGGGADDGHDNGPERGIATKVREKTKKPSMYRVMMNVHKNGIGVCGIYTFEVAETKVAQVMDAAKRSQHPLQCTLEKE